MEQRYAMMEEIKEQVPLLRILFERRKELCREFVSLYQKRRFKKIFL